MRHAGYLIFILPTYSGVVRGLLPVTVSILAEKWEIFHTPNLRQVKNLGNFKVNRTLKEPMKEIHYPSSFH
jgi:hypothetical protein